MIKKIQYYKKKDFPAETVALIISTFKYTNIPNQAKAYHYIIEEHMDKPAEKQFDIIGYSYWLQDKYDLKTDNRFYALNKNVKSIYDAKKNNIDSITSALDTLDKLAVITDTSESIKLINNEIDKLSKNMISQPLTNIQKLLLKKFIELLKGNNR